MSGQTPGDDLNLGSGLHTNAFSWRCRAASGAPAVSVPPMAAENLGPIFGNINAPRLDRDASAGNAAAAAATTPISAFGPGPVSGPTPPSATSHDHGYGYAHSISHSSDPSLEPTIRALLNQHAEIETRLAALLPRKYGPNVSFELDMLRHKYKALCAFADNNRKQQDASSPPYVSCLRNCVWRAPSSAWLDGDTLPFC